MCDLYVLHVIKSVLIFNDNQCDIARVKTDFTGKDKVMRIKFNGEELAVADGISVLQCLELQSLDSSRVVVELNMNIVLSGKYAETILQEDDILEVLHFVGGG